MPVDQSGSRHARAAPAPVLGFVCPACGADQPGKIEEGCTACGAGRPGRKVEAPDQGLGTVRTSTSPAPPAPPAPSGSPLPQEVPFRFVPDAVVKVAQQLFATEAMRKAFMTGWLYAEEIFVPGDAPPPAEEPQEGTAESRTIIAALELFCQQVLVEEPEEVTSGEWLSVQEVQKVIARLRKGKVDE